MLDTLYSRWFKMDQRRWNYFRTGIRARLLQRWIRLFSGYCKLHRSLYITTSSYRHLFITSSNYTSAVHCLYRKRQYDFPIHHKGHVDEVHRLLNYLEANAVCCYLLKGIQLNNWKVEITAIKVGQSQTTSNLHSSAIWMRQYVFSHYDVK